MPKYMLLCHLFRPWKFSTLSKGFYSKLYQTLWLAIFLKHLKNIFIHNHAKILICYFWNIYVYIYLLLYFTFLLTLKRKLPVYDEESAKKMFQDYGIISIFFFCKMLPTNILQLHIICPEILTHCKNSVSSTPILQCTSPWRLLATLRTRWTFLTTFHTR